MSIHHAGRWHYERVLGRDNGREWRVADEDDDFITDFVIEKDAAEMVRRHNKYHASTTPGWRF